MGKTLPNICVIANLIIKSNQIELKFWKEKKGEPRKILLRAKHGTEMSTSELNLEW